jgi:hypothetical protein
MDVKIERLGQGERIAAGSALALLASMFLSWFNFGFDASNAWESLHYISPVLSIAIAATLALTFLEASDRSAGDVPAGLVIFVLGCLSTLLVLYRLIDPISAPAFEGGSASASVEAGAFLALFAAAGIAGGGYVATDGRAIERLKALLPSGGGGNTAGSFPTPAPPRRPAPVAPPPPRPEPAPAPPASPEPPVPPAPPEPEPAPPEPEPAPEPEPLATAPAEANTPSEISGDGQARSVFCESCGAPIRPKDRFCGKCGDEQTTAAGA